MARPAADDMLSKSQVIREHNPIWVVNSMLINGVWLESVVENAAILMYVLLFNFLLSWLRYRM